MDRDSDLREKINLDDLYTRTHKLDDLKLNVYKRILNRAHAKIKHTSRQRNTEHWCFFIVPEFLVGTPRYDSGSCIAYIMDKLMANGFLVKYTHPNLLFISWRHYIPRRERIDFKKKYGYTIDGFGNHVPDKQSTEKKNSPTDVNSILVRKSNVPVTVKKANKEYTKISEYVPTGNLIYNKALLKRIETNINK